MKVEIHAFLILALGGSESSNSHPCYFIAWKTLSEPIGDWEWQPVENSNPALALPPDFLETHNGKRGKIYRIPAKN
jgi:hypothetical protein